jgi:hypothetical protein
MAHGIADTVVTARFSTGLIADRITGSKKTEPDCARI